ncbi:MAG TPA: terminase [Gammaproteobacteria bacterium]|jgi:hypothetical protein
MGPRELLRWQWEGYPRYHTRRASLLLHLFSMPFFWAGTLLLSMALVTLSGSLALWGFLCLPVPVIAQGFGHKRIEPTAAAPFTSPWNFVARFCLEQWINLPRFILSGGWGRAFRDA